MSLEEQIRALLEPLSLTSLNITDESQYHQGHLADGQHFYIEAVGDVFLGKNRVQRQRLILQALQNLIPDTVHAVRLKTQTLQESKAG